MNINTIKINNLAKKLTTMKKIINAILFMIVTISVYAQSDQDVPVAGAQVFNDDLIAVGSLAIGIDASSSESFGFDTFRMKENNLRIHFDDTSASADFPGNDWRITINDSGNGGQNYFGIDDATAGNSPFRIMAGSGANALFVSDSGGNVGLGTNTPVVELQVTDGDSPAIRIEQNGANGWTPQTWDIAGNETNFFIRDVTNGSKLPFKIKPGAPDNAVFIAASGNVSLGDANPSEKLEVNGNASIIGNTYVTQQLGVGTTTPNANASLDLTSNVQGVLINRMTTAERTTFTASLTVAEDGMLIYDTDEKITYSWNGTAWVNVAGEDAQGTDVFELNEQTLSLSLDNNANQVDVDLSPILTDVEARLDALEEAQSMGTGQVPELLNYQSVVKDASGAVLANQFVTFRMSVLKGGATGESVYSELHQVTTSDIGMVSFQIGNGSSATSLFRNIDWGADSYFLFVELNADGGFVFQNVGTTQFVSVPYALRAKTADTVNNSVLNKQLQDTEEALETTKKELEALKAENKAIKSQIEMILKKIGK